MTIQSWLIYLMLALVATSTPGPAVLFIVTNSALHGWRKASFSALGNITAIFCMALISITGLGAILNTSVIVFNVIKYAGAFYLILLGLKLFFQKSPAFNTSQSQAVSGHISSSKIFFQAFGVAVSNPKAIVFLTALFPQFLNIKEPLTYQFLILIITLMILSFFFLMLYALMAHRAKAWLKSSRHVRLFSRISGSVFMGVGVLLAASSNK